MRVDLPFIEKIRAAIASGKQFTMATIVGTAGSSPQKAGAKMIVFEDGTIDGTVGGGAIEHRIIEDSIAAIAGGEPMLKRYDLKRDAGMICGGEMSAFIEPMGARERVLVFGCGHVSRALAPVLVNLDFSVTVVDDRPEWADPGAFPPAVSVVCTELEQYLGGLDEGLQDLYVLSLTRGHKFDYRILRHFIELDLPYLGIMASKKKAAEFQKALAEEGLDEPLVSAVSMPVGIPISSSTPEEIAISIAGELISVRKRATR